MQLDKNEIKNILHNAMYDYYVIDEIANALDSTVMDVTVDPNKIIPNEEKGYLDVTIRFKLK